MKTHHASILVALSLPLAILVGCGAEPEAVTAERGAAVTGAAGYGYEFEDDNIVAPGPAKNDGPATSPDVLNGRVAPEVIRDVVRAQSGAIKVCHAAARQRDPAVQGKVTVRFIIRPDGTVEDAKDGGSTVNDAAMVGCVVGAFSALHFAASTAGLITVVYPLVFTP